MRLCQVHSRRAALQLCHSTEELRYLDSVLRIHSAGYFLTGPCLPDPPARSCVQMSYGRRCLCEVSPVRTGTAIENARYCAFCEL